MTEAGQPLIQIEDLTKVFYTDEIETHALSGVHLAIRKGGAIGLRKIDAAFDYRLTGYAYCREVSAEWARCRKPRLRRALTYSQSGDRVHLSEFQSDRRSHGL